ncbi:MAG: cytochrome b/b6 domain-containing protein [Caulobacterales bacterium]
MKADRYAVLAIVLHWAIAILIVFNILLGWWMHDAIEDAGTAARAIIGYQAHKSIGLTVLTLSLIRLGWRIANPPPALPGDMPAWEKLAAKATHWVFYALMILIPLTGWLYVSAGWSHENDRPLSVPTFYFGLFQVPHLFGLEHAANDTRESVAGASIEAHELLVWGALALLALHVGAALKHWLIDKDGVTPKMIPGLPVLGAHEKSPADPKRRLALMGGFAALLIGLGAIFAFTAQQPPAAPAQTAEQIAPPPSSDTVTMPEAPAATTAPTPSVPGAAPPAWNIDAAQSAIRFSGVHAGVPFNGRFSRWRADIRFDPENLDASNAVVTIQTGSASDGIAMHDQSLPQAEWLDSSGHPTATFRTTRIRHREGNNYEARGVLNLKGKDLRIDMPFTLTIAGNRAVMSGRATIDRREADIGMQSDPDAEYVSREIAINIHVEAARAQ